IKCNVGDFFIADFGSGREGMFKITEITDNSLFKQKVYEITYLFTGFVDDDNGLQKRNMDSKVIEEYFFQVDFLRMGQNPLLVDSEYNALEELRLLESSLLDEFVNEFVNYEHNTFTVPDDNGGVIYDPFVAQAVLDVNGIDRHPLLAKVRRL